MGKGGQQAPSAGASDATEVLIEGTLYDVADFKHPGGSIVKFLTGHGDATEAFREFHGRSKKAKAMLKALPRRVDAEATKRRAYNGKEALAKDFAQFRTQLESEGFFDPIPSEIAYRCLEVVAMHALGVWLMRATDLFYTGVVVLGLVL